MKMSKRFAGVLPFFLAFALRGLSYLRYTSFSFRSDDFGPLIYPAALAGYDWKVFVTSMSKYYGYGYYWIFAPLFRAFSSSTTIILAISMINTVFISLTAVLIAHLLRHYFQIDGIIAVVIAVFCTIFEGDIDLTSTSIVYRTDNEVPLFLICWLLIWLILWINRYGREKKKAWMLGSAGVSLLLIWALSVHERSMSLVLAVVITELLLLVLTRRFLFHPLPFFGILGAGYFGQKFLRKAIIFHFFGRTSVQNTDAFDKVSLWFLQGLTQLKAFLILLIGNMHSAVIKSFGLVVICLAMVVFWLLRNRHFLHPDQNKKEDAPALNAEMLIGLIFLGTVAIVILGLSIRWGEGIYKGLLKDKVVSKYKGICYGRYYYAFLGPLCFSALVYLVKKLQKAGSTLLLFWPVFLGIEVIFLKLVFPYCQREGEMDYVLRANSLQLFTGLSQTWNVYINIGILILLYLFLTLSVFVKKEYLLKLGTVLPAILLLCMVTANRLLNHVDLSRIGFSISRWGNIAALLQEIDAEVGLPEIVYVRASSTNPSHYYLQLTLPDQDFSILWSRHDDLEDSGEGERIIIRGSLNEELTEAGYSYSMIDEKYVYTNSETYYRYIQSYAQEE